MQHPLRVSSSWTLFYKVFLPTVWIAFFGSMTLFVVVMSGVGRIRASALVIGVLLALFATGFIFLWFTFMQLKRVEMADDGFYVTNYFKTFKYNYEAIAAVQEMDLLVMKVAVFKFVQTSSFGRKIYFIERRKLWREFVEEHPQHFAHLAGGG